MRRASRFFFVPLEDPVRGRTAEDHRLLELLDPVAEAEGCAIVRLRLMGGDKARRLQILAERADEEGSLPVGDCARLSRQVAHVLDDADPISGAYILEVSSPGVERPLTRLADFDACKGLLAKLELERPVDGRKRFKGRLAGIAGGEVLVETEDGGGLARLPFDDLGDARLVMDEALMARGAALRAARLAKAQPHEEGFPMSATP